MRTRTWFGGTRRLGSVSHGGNSGWKEQYWWIIERIDALQRRIIVTRPSARCDAFRSHASKQSGIEATATAVGDTER